MEPIRTIAGSAEMVLEITHAPPGGVAEAEVIRPNGYLILADGHAEAGSDWHLAGMSYEKGGFVAIRVSDIRGVKVLSVHEFDAFLDKLHAERVRNSKDSLEADQGFMAEMRSIAKDIKERVTRAVDEAKKATAAPSPSSGPSAPASGTGEGRPTPPA